MITDTDHYAPGKGDALWAWKSFLRGHHPILMDFGIIDVVNPLDPSLGVPRTKPSNRRATRWAIRCAYAQQDEAHRDGAARRSQLDRLCAGESRRGVSRPSAERDVPSRSL